MACGCPVITSNRTGTKETAGSAALLVNPRSVKEIKEAMESIYTDDELRSELTESGLSRAAEFSWEKSAESHLILFRKAIEEND